MFEHLKYVLIVINTCSVRRKAYGASVLIFEQSVIFCKTILYYFKDTFVKKKILKINVFFVEILHLLRVVFVLIAVYFFLFELCS